jgi:hypothetical protein
MLLPSSIFPPNSIVLSFPQRKYSALLKDVFRSLFTLLEIAYVWFNLTWKCIIPRASLPAFLRVQYVSQSVFRQYVFNTLNFLTKLQAHWTSQTVLFAGLKTWLYKFRISAKAPLFLI